jgi:hypothetical protein
MAEKLREQVNPQHLPVRRASAGATHARSRQTQQPTDYGIQQHEDEDDDAIYTQRPPTSAIRYTQPREEVYRQGNRRIVVHREPPKKRRFHWMIFMGMVMFVMVLGWFIFTAFGVWWQAKQDDWKYGTPRTFQVDEYVGHGDTPDHPDHFIALNLDGVIQVIEMNPQNPKLDHVYLITTVNDRSIPVFLSFEDTNHDGKIDMFVTIGDSNSYVVILLNTGTVFQH